MKMRKFMGKKYTYYSSRKENSYRMSIKLEFSKLMADYGPCKKTTQHVEVLDTNDTALSLTRSRNSDQVPLLL